MNLVKILINKKTIALLVIILLGGILYYNLKSSKLFTRVKGLEKDYATLTQNFSRMTRDNQELKDNYAKLQKDLQAVSLERDNLLVQSRGLLEDRERARSLEAEVGKLEARIDAVTKEKEAAINQGLGVKDAVRRVLAEKEQVIKEKRELQDALEKERSGYTLKKLQVENSGLIKDKNNLNNSLKNVQSESIRYQEANTNFKRDLAKTKDELARAKAEIAGLNKKVGDFTASYNEALKKNKLLEQKTIDMPRKFAELARQNKTLIRETANMHYNLGVFYTKNKEYSRAAAELEKALELNPEDAYAHFNLGYIYAEYMVNRQKAIEQFKQYLRLAKKDDKDVDWVKKYILTWQTWEGKEKIQ